MAWERAAAEGRSSSLPLATRKLGGANVRHWDLAKYPANMGPSLKRQELWIFSRILILEKKETSGSEKTLEEKVKTLALRRSLCLDPRELDATYS